MRHKSPITGIDFSVSGDVIRSSSVGNDLYFFNADDASNLSSLASLRDLEWESNRSIFAWQSLGIHGSALPGENITSTALNSSATLLVSGSDFGFLKLFNAPAVSLNTSKCSRYKGHSGAIAQVVCSSEDVWMASVGRYDRAILQWRVRTFLNLNSDNNKTVIDAETFGREALSSHDLSRFLSSFSQRSLLSHLSGEIGVDESRLEVKTLLPSSVGTDSWLGSIFSPTVPLIHSKSIPRMNLQLSRVYGFSCLDLRNNVCFTSTGDVLFTAGSISVIASDSGGSQSFHRIHDGVGISAFAISSDAQLAATAQIGGGQSKVAVWDTLTRRTLIILPDALSFGISALAFSKDSIYLAIASLDEDYTVSIYDWRRSARVSRVQSGDSRVMGISFNALATQMICASASYIRCYTRSNHLLTSIPLSTGAFTIQPPFLCCVSFNEDVVVSSYDGHLLVVSGTDGRLVKCIKAHAGSIDALCSLASGALLASGGADGRIKVWSNNYDCLHDISIDSLASSGPYGLSALSLSLNARRVVFGTRGGLIAHMLLPSSNGAKEPSSSSSPSSISVIVQGQSRRELWGIASHPTKSMFATAGDDAYLRVYDAVSFTLLRSVKLDAPSRAVTFSPDGKYVVAGYGANLRDKAGKLPFKGGGFVVFRSTDFKKVHEGKDSNEPLRILRFSSDSKLLAAGSEDGRVHVYTVEDLFRVRTVLSCHKAAVRHIDFSLDGQFIMSVDAANKVCCSESTSGVFIPNPAALRDEKWGSWTNPFSWPVLGLWITLSAASSGSQLAAVQKSCAGGLVVAGTSTGAIMVVNFPCPSRSGFLLE